MRILITKAIMVARRITGSSSINNGTFPYVSVTIDDESSTKQNPEERITTPAWNPGLMRAIR